MSRPGSRRSGQPSLGLSPNRLSEYKPSITSDGPGSANRLCHRARKYIGELTSNPTVRKLTFSGSTEVGELLTQQCAGTGQEIVAGIGRQRPVHRLRRRRYRDGGQGCDRLEIPQCRPDLRVRQPDPGAGLRLRRLYQAAPRDRRCRDRAGHATLTGLVWAAV
jgi:hypothetical protein